MSNASAAMPQPWYRALNRSQWNTLFASNLGWLFDGYETYALILTVGVALHQLLMPSQFKEIPAYAGSIIALTLLGWGIGGVVGGILADYIGRRRTMIFAILAYSLTTGLSALAWNWESFAVLRLIVGIAIGSEWVTGTSMTAELWPDAARGRGAGLMQCGLGIGFFVASFVWLFVGGHGPGAWRYMYLIGILPALFTLWVRRGIPESSLWQETDARRRGAMQRKREGATLEAHEHALARFTLVDMFSAPEVRRRVIIALLMSFTTTLAWWGIAAWVPPYVGSVAAKAGLAAPQWAGYAGMCYNIGAIVGYIGLGFLADAFGRKPVVMLFFALAFIMTPVLFLWTHSLGLLLLACAVNGFFTLGQYSWMPVWLPELFPTRSRGTAVAFCFNAPRFIACIGPLVAGQLIVHFGGFGNAAMIFACIYFLGLVVTPFLPETKAKPLPSEV
ncbi:MAG TPA: MFS transporter [Alphaproteobacteria bacterium]|nr:MFS transporter [Alphaproteobacteria bacterium]